MEVQTQLMQDFGHNPCFVPQVLALTFDDGPHAGGLNGLLDVLKAQRVPAAFFINTAPTWGKPFDSQPNQVSCECSSRSFPLTDCNLVMATTGAQQYIAQVESNCLLVLGAYCSRNVG
jgi:hypothetical protein